MSVSIVNNRIWATPLQPKINRVKKLDNLVFSRSAGIDRSNATGRKPSSADLNGSIPSPNG